VAGYRGQPGSGVRDAINAAKPGTMPLVHLKPNADTGHITAGTLVLIGLDDRDPAGLLRATLDRLPEGVLIGLAEAGVIGEVRAYRLLAAVIEERFAQDEREQTGSGQRPPICIALPYQHDELAVAAIAGSLLIDGLGDALYLPSVADPRRLAFTILQAVKARITRADYVSCPSCGRTLFDLIEVTAHIRQVTSHLDGVTIAIMGCIVNGPGEMADADFGFVGSGPGKVDLYRGRDKVRNGIPFAGARDELVALIKEAGKWREPG
jgi:(E)-4-hydroxy-3-methylbut-2-enyl-diphosphate synthase